MADETTQQLVNLLGVTSLPVPITSVPTPENIRLIFKNILGIEPTAEQLKSYTIPGSTIQDVYNDIINNKGRESGTVITPEQAPKAPESTVTATRTPSPNDSAVTTIFNTYVKRSPTDDELDTFGKLYDPANPTLAISLIKDIGTSEAAEKGKVTTSLPSGVNHLIMFTDDPTKDDPATGTNTVWLYNSNDYSLDGNNYSGTLIPFTTESAFNNFFKGVYTLQEAEQMGQIEKKPTSELANSGSVFYKSRLLNYNNGIDSTGRMPVVEEIRWHYGQERDDAKEDTIIKGMLAFFKSLVGKDPGFSQKYYDNAFTGENLYKYANAAVYGAYDLTDLYKDIVAHNKRVEGDPAFANYKGISTVANADVWKKTSPDYQTATSGKTAITPPEVFKDIKISDLSSLLFKIPDKFFKIISEQAVDVTDPKTIAEIEKIQTFVTDVAIQTAEADNAQDLAAAKYNWGVLKDDIERTYNITLSNNAFDAWNQLETMKGSMADAGLTNSGVFNRAMDEIMKTRRRQDKYFMEQSHSQEDQELRSHLLNYGTTEEIADFIANNSVEKAKEWGLIPDDATIAFFNIDNMRKMYPGVSDKELQAVIDTMISKTASGQIVNNSVLIRNHLANMKNLKEQKFEEQKDIYLGKKVNEYEKAFEDVTSAGLFDVDYKGDANAPAGAAGATTVPLNWKPVLLLPTTFAQRVEAEKAAGRNPENSFARTSGANIYVRNLGKEAEALSAYIKATGINPTKFGGMSPERKAFNDYVYEGKLKSGVTITPKPVTTDAAKAAENISTNLAPETPLAPVTPAKTALDLPGFKTLASNLTKQLNQAGLKNIDQINQIIENNYIKREGGSIYSLGNTKPVTDYYKPASPTVKPTTLTAEVQMPSYVISSAQKAAEAIAQPTPMAQTKNFGSGPLPPMPAQTSSIEPAAQSGVWKKGTITYNPDVHGYITEPNLIEQGFKKS